MLNTVILMGRPTTDIELKLTPNGIEVCNFTLAVDRYQKKGEEKQTDFIDCVAWRGTAAFLHEWFKKGQLMAVEGSIQVRQYQDKDGNKRKAVEIVVEQAHFAERKQDKPVRENATQGDFGGNTQFEEIEEQGELPF